MTHPHPDTARPCPECDGDGTVAWKTCGHSGSACPCRRYEAECEECNGTGALPCSYCGEGVAVVWESARTGYCEDCREHCEVDHAA